MAWKGQRLPFDVSNQRVIAEDRDFIDLDANKKKLVTFIRSAAQGKYYRPMEAVGRLATIEAASESLGEDSLLRALAQEVRDLRASVMQAAFREPRQWKERPLTLKKFIRGKVFRKDLFAHFVSLGGNAALWPRLLGQQLTAEQINQMQSWGLDEWKDYVTKRGHELIESAPDFNAANAATPFVINPELLEKVKELLPVQPWPTGIHKTVAEKLGLSSPETWKYIRELIRRGDFNDQVDGQLLIPVTASAAESESKLPAAAAPAAESETKTASGS
jgi:hypothetical protein